MASQDRKRSNQQDLPHNTPVKKKKPAYPLTPGIEGFFITCENGWEYLAAREALSVLHYCFEDLVSGQGAAGAYENEEASMKVSNKKITFTYAGFSDCEGYVGANENKRQVSNTKVTFTYLDSSDIEAGADDDKSKRRFFKIEPDCKGVVIIQLNKQDGEPSPKDIVEQMERSVSTGKLLAKYLHTVLPIMASCSSSEEEISKAVQPLITEHFPSKTEYAVVYDARANNDISRKKIMDTIIKSVPKPHKFALKDPKRSIVVIIIKTICLLGVVEKYQQFNIESAHLKLK